jgi:hypothetical protein
MGRGPVPCSARQPRLRESTSSGEALMTAYVGMGVHPKRSQVAVVDNVSDFAGRAAWLA